MKATITPQNNKPWWWRNRFALTSAITLTSFLLCIAAYGLGFIPTKLMYESTAASSATIAKQEVGSTTSLTNIRSTSKVPKDELPNRISIPSVDIDTSVQNPASKRVNVLNKYLAESAVRYPGSGKPGNGNMFIFGHSSGLDSVINQAYKTFNSLENLSAGDKIFVSTKSGTFNYKVSDVTYKKDSAAYVPFDTKKNMLTIATCDNFGTKEDRIIVRAEFAGYTTGGS